MDLARSDKRRYLKALAGEIPDRVPVHETVINGRYIRHVLGLDGYDLSTTMPPEHIVPLYQQVGIDMAAVAHFWRPTQFNTWERVRGERFPSHQPFLHRVDEYAAYLKGQTTGLLVYVHGPLDSAYLSMGYEEFFLASKIDPELVAAVMDRFTESHLELLHELVKRPIDVIQIVDDLAMQHGTFLEPAEQRALWLPRMRQLIEPVVAAGIPLQFHSDGKVDYFMDDIIEMGFRAVNPIDPTCNDIAEVKRRWGDRITLMGNMDIAGTLAFGTPDQVRAEMLELLEVMMPGGRYIAMSGSSISDGVVPENYDAMVEAVLAHGWYGPGASRPAGSREAGGTVRMAD